MEKHEKYLLHRLQDMETPTEKAEVAIATLSKDKKDFWISVTQNDSCNKIRQFILL